MQDCSCDELVDLFNVYKRLIFSKLVASYWFGMEEMSVQTKVPLSVH